MNLASRALAADGSARAARFLPIEGAGHTFGAAHPMARRTSPTSTACSMPPSAYSSRTTGAEMSSILTTPLSDLTGRICVVTGASRGIGRATAEGLAALGATVVLAAAAPRTAPTWRTDTAAGGQPPTVVRCDLASRASIRAAAGDIARPGDPGGSTFSSTTRA